MSAEHKMTVYRIEQPDGMYRFDHQLPGREQVVSVIGLTVQTAEPVELPAGPLSRDEAGHWVAELLTGATAVAIRDCLPREVPPSAGQPLANGVRFAARLRPAPALPVA